MRCVACLVLSVFAFTTTAAADDSSVLAKVSVEQSSIGGGGRNIMRTAEGALISFFAVSTEGQSSLYFLSSTDGGKTWYAVSPTTAGKSVGLIHPAVDSNFNGAYMAYIERTKGRSVGKVIYSSNPLAPKKGFVHSDSVTPPLGEVTGTFIAASRVGWGDKPDAAANTVAYGWADESTGDLYVGVSTDGKTFPKAAKVFSSKHVASGPAVTIHGNNVFLTFLTADPAMAPAELKRGKDAPLFPAWMESSDAGKTWSNPVPLFGKSVKDFPLLQASEAKGLGTVVKGAVRAAGGSPGWLSSTLVWDASAKPSGGELIFVVNALSPVTADDGPLTPGSFDDPENLIGVVSFRRMAPGSKWTHVPSNLELLRTPAGRKTLNNTLGPLGATLAASNAKGEQHQYSALIDTPVRATTYVERTGSGADASTAIVVASSIDTGKVFDHFAKFDRASLEKLGLPVSGKLMIDVSQCLFEDRNGEVYVDVLAHDLGGANTITYFKLPLGVNAQALREKAATPSSR